MTVLNEAEMPLLLYILRRVLGQQFLKYDSKNPIIQNVHISLLVVHKNNIHISFCCVSVHCGIKSNGFADKASQRTTNFSKNCNNYSIFRH